MTDDELLQKVYMIRGDLMKIAEELKERIKQNATR